MASAAKTRGILLENSRLPTTDATRGPDKQNQPERTNQRKAENKRGQRHAVMQIAAKAGSAVFHLSGTFLVIEGLIGFLNRRHGSQNRGWTSKGVMRRTLIKIVV